MLSTIDAAPTRVHRVVRKQNDWTLKEHEVVVSHWPDVETIQKSLPHRRPPAPTGHRLMDAILHRAFHLNMSRRDLDAVCGGKGEPFSRWSPARKLCIRKIKQAVDYMGGELDVVWEPLEN